MSLDTYNEHNHINPINQKENEPLTELEQQQDWNQDLLKRIQSQKSDLIKLKEIEESFKTFGFLSYEESTEKNNILNKY